MKKSGTDAVTCQPRPGVRQATVVLTTAKGYTVVAGRSLRKIEERIDTLGQQVLFGWLVSMIAILGVVFSRDILIKRASGSL